MGVKDLWQLLAPIGRRVSIETLEGKTLAIDASVWIVQFIKAFRNEDGSMVKNAHIIGTLKRILKLLYHKIKPVFVFDGATPQLKIRTVRARREKKFGYERDQKLVAQRILISQLKQNAIKNSIKSLKPILNTNTNTNGLNSSSLDEKYSSTFKPLPIANRDNDVKSSSSSSSSSSSLINANDTAQPCFDSSGNNNNDSSSSSSSSINNNNNSSTSNNNNNSGSSSSSSSSSSSAAMAEGFFDSIHDIEWQDEHDSRHNKKLSNQKLKDKRKNSSSHNILNNNDDDSDGDNNDNSSNNNDDSNDDDDDDDDSIQYDLPEDGAELDVHVLASLPNHLRKDVIEAARKKERIRSRNHYIPVAEDPSLYSLTQLANFLKGSRLNKKIATAQTLVDELEDGGKRIAAEGGKKYWLTTGNDVKKSVTGVGSGSGSTSEKKSEKYDWLDEVDGEVSDTKDDDDDDGDDDGNATNTTKNLDNPHHVSKPRKRLNKNKLIPTATTTTTTSSSSSSSYAVQNIELHSIECSPKIPTSLSSSSSSSSTTTCNGHDDIVDINDVTNNNNNDDDDDDDDSSSADGGGFLVDDDDGDDNLHANTTTTAITTSTATTTVTPTTTTTSTSSATSVDGIHSDDNSTGNPLPVTASTVLSDDLLDIEWESDDDDDDGNSGTYNNNNHHGDGDDDDDDDINFLYSSSTSSSTLLNPHEISGSIPAYLSNHHDEITSTTTASTAIPHPRVLSSAVAERAVTMASGMADWAGRAVQRALREHLMASGSGSSSSHHQQQQKAVAQDHHQQQQKAVVQHQPIVIPKESSLPSSSHNNSSSIISLLDDIHTTKSSSSSSSSIVAGSTDDMLTTEHDLEVAVALKQEDEDFPYDNDNTNSSGGSNNNNTNSSSSSSAHVAEYKSVPSLSAVPSSSSSSFIEADTASTKQLSPTVISSSSSSSSSLSLPPPVLNQMELESLLHDEELLEQVAQRSRAMNMRDAEAMTEEMRDDVIALLHVFEIPYIISPFEAEAQCAVLEQLKVVDGVVTEDSDAFLFGAGAVYRHIFHDQKYVEVYLASDAFHELGLTRDDFVALAFFLGSDYTEGISGIGIVNALEVLQAFSMKKKNDNKKSMKKMNTKKEEKTIVTTTIASSSSKGNQSSKQINNNTSNDDDDNDDDDDDDEMRIERDDEEGDRGGSGVEWGLSQFKRWIEGYDAMEMIHDKFIRKRERGREREGGGGAQANKKKKKKKKTLEKDDDDDHDNNNSDDDDDDDDDDDNSDDDDDNSDDDDDDDDEAKKSDTGNGMGLSVSEEPNIFSDDTTGRIVSGATAEAASDTTTQEAKLYEFTQKHRSGRMSWKVPGNFPDKRVIDAYLNPAACTDSTAFTWTTPKLHRIRKYCSEILGWTDSMMDVQIDPVIRRFMDRGNIQPRIDSHFMSYKDNNRFAMVASDRLYTAVTQITGKTIVKSAVATSGRSGGKGKGGMTAKTSTNRKQKIQNESPSKDQKTKKSKLDTSNDDGNNDDCNGNNNGRDMNGNGNNHTSSAEMELGKGDSMLMQISPSSSSLPSSSSSLPSSSSQNKTKRKKSKK